MLQPKVTSCFRAQPTYLLLSFLHKIKVGFSLGPLPLGPKGTLSPWRVPYLSRVSNTTTVLMGHGACYIPLYFAHSGHTNPVCLCADSGGGRGGKGDRAGHKALIAAPCVPSGQSLNLTVSRPHYLNMRTKLVSVYFIKTQHGATLRV